MRQILGVTMRIGGIVCTLMLSACTSPYTEHYTQEQKSTTSVVHIQQATKSFDAQAIGMRNDATLVVSPSKSAKEAVMHCITTAQKHVWLEGYILTEKDIIRALKQAAERGVDTRVLLEGKVFGGNGINRTAMESLSGSKAQIRYRGLGSAYAFMHSKYVVCDDTFIVSTGNFSHSTYTKNREFLVVGKNAADRETLVQLFDALWNNRHIAATSSGLIIAPDETRTKLERTITSAKKTLDIASQNMADDSIVRQIIAAYTRGVQIRILLPDVKDVDSNTDAIQTLKRAGIAIKTLKKPYLHAKSFVIDGEVVYIGSINFTQNSIEKNREVGVLMRNTRIATEWTQVFEGDWKNGKTP